jgi:hypothetical protein
MVHVARLETGVRVLFSTHPPARNCLYRLVAAPLFFAIRNALAAAGAYCQIITLLGI